MSNNGYIPDLASIVNDHLTRTTEEHVRFVAQIASEISDREVDKYFWQVSMFMASYRKPSVTGFEKVTWLPLNREYLLRKPFKGFWYTGYQNSSGNRMSLRSYLQQVKSVAGVFFDKTKYRTSKKRKYGEKGDYKLHIRPGIAKLAEMNGGVSGGLFSRSSGAFSSEGAAGHEQWVKVDGTIGAVGMSNEEFRPIFRPTAEYLMRYKIPRAINMELKRRRVMSELTAGRKASAYKYTTRFITNQQFS